MLEHQPGEIYTDEFGVKHVCVIDSKWMDGSETCHACSVNHLCLFYRLTLERFARGTLKFRCGELKRKDKTAVHYELYKEE